MGEKLVIFFQEIDKIERIRIHIMYSIPSHIILYPKCDSGRDYLTAAAYLCSGASKRPPPLHIESVEVVGFGTLRRDSREGAGQFPNLTQTVVERESVRVCNFSPFRAAV